MFKPQCLDFIIPGLDNVLQYYKLVLQLAHLVLKVACPFIRNQDKGVQLISNLAVNIDMDWVWLAHLCMDGAVVMGEGPNGRFKSVVGWRGKMGRGRKGHLRVEGGETESLASAFCGLVLDFILLVNAIE
jgi:hypothetical protein